MSSRWYIVNEKGEFMRGPCSLGRARQLLAVLRLAYPGARLTEKVQETKP